MTDRENPTGPSFRVTDEEKRWLAAAADAGATPWQIMVGLSRNSATVYGLLRKLRARVLFHDANAARWRRPDVIAHIAACWHAGDALEVIAADLRERFGVTASPSRVSEVARHELGLPARGCAGWQPSGRRAAPQGRPPRTHRAQIMEAVATRQIARVQAVERGVTAREMATLERRCDVCRARFKGPACPNGHAVAA